MDDLFDKLRAGGSTFAAKYLDNFRYAEFCAVVAAAGTGGLNLGTSLGLDQTRAQYIGLFVAAVAALAFFRNPKRKGWQGDEGAETNDSIQ